MKFIATRIAAACVLLGALSASPAAFSHHSYAMFDLSQTVTLQGTIREFQWTNPHSWIWIDVPDAKGDPQQWGIEGMSPNYLARRGWSKRTLKQGDKVSVVIHPLKGAEHGGSFMSVTLPDGTVMNMSGSAAAASPRPDLTPLPKTPAN